MQPSDYEDPAAADYVNDLVDKHSQEEVSDAFSLKNFHEANAHSFSLLFSLLRKMNTDANVK